MSGSRNRFLQAILLFAAGILVSCVRNESSEAKDPQKQKRSENPATLRISQRNEPGDLDPALAAIPDDYFVIRALSEGLVVPSPSGTDVLPAAADSWLVSENGLSYSFHLRPGARWSDGSAVKASDFLESFRRSLSPNTPAPKVHLFYPVRGARAFHEGKSQDFGSVGIKILSEDTLVITLETPLPGFLLYVASGPWIPIQPACLAKHGKNWTRPGNFIGNGAFVLTEWQPHKRITVTRRPDYWDAEHVLINSIEFIAIDNGETEERAFRAGQLDVTMSVPASKMAAYAADPTTPLRQASLQETRYLSFNTLRAPLTDFRVRLALSLAIDRPAITNRLLFGGQISTSRLVPPLLAPQTQVKEPFCDVASARELLAEAGFPEGKGFPTLELSGWTNLPVLEAIQDMWRKNLGIQVTLSMRDAKVHIAALQAGSYDIGMITAIPDASDAMLLLTEYRPESAGNYPHWVDSEYVSLLNQADQSTTQADRLQIMSVAETHLLQNAPLAPLYFNTRNYLVHPRVQGWMEDGFWNRFYKGVRIKNEH